jgi:hypothetical protein
MTEQLSSTEGMTPEQIVAALSEGRLSDYCKTPNKRSRGWDGAVLRNMTPEQIAVAVTSGELDEILGTSSAVNR